MQPSIHSLLRGLAVALLLATVSLYGHAGYLYSKAVLAQWLIADAWQQSLAEHKPVRPWPWADTWPVARLKYQNHDTVEDLYVLEGAAGNSLAFGPGHMAGTALPGTPGNSVVGGHRDTHFAFLKELQVGDHLQVQGHQGEWHTYRIDQARIRDINQGPLWLESGVDALQLITCYPFDSISSGGPLRYQVSLLRLNND
ncbi:class GN sortase [Pseudomaricurvus sp.]|uniref:class GN sortase n=1 Tax=Pseudomaricurvus sp. TaxID=2004510 RepID=UPI003F6B0BB7